MDVVGYASILLVLLPQYSYNANTMQSSTTQRFGNLEMLKRPTDPASIERRSSLHDSYGKPGFLGTMWNKSAQHLTHVLNRY